MDGGDVSVVIPTYAREQVLVETLEYVLAQRPSDVVVVDQTPRHTAPVEDALTRLDRDATIRLLRLSRPAIPGAMNAGLRAARRPVVLFLDDDIVPGAGLLEAHAAGHGEPAVWAVAGQVLQPGQEAAPPARPYRTRGLHAYLEFPFNSSEPAFIENGMAGNLSVRRERALAIGGFDEGFAGVAYRFETEFCRRLCRAGGRIRFEPAASIRHLRAPTGGTRSHGDFRRSASPAHGVGDYYFALGHGTSPAVVRYVMRRLVHSVATRFHARHPWWIPVKLVGEIRALAWAIRLSRQRRETEPHSC